MSVQSQINQCAQRLLTMWDNTAPYTAQEAHLLTTKSKVVDKYTAEQKNLGVLTEAQSFMGREKSIGLRGLV